MNSGVSILMIGKPKSWYFEGGGSEKCRNSILMRKLLTLFGIINIWSKINYNNKFKKMQQLQFSLANRAMFSLLRKCRQLNLPLDIQLELFEKCVHPILLYGCEIWAFEKMDVIWKLQLWFLKLILGVNVTTPTCMVLGEVGRYPIEIEAKCRM